jgi:hypothetical protein
VIYSTGLRPNVLPVCIDGSAAGFADVPQHSRFGGPEDGRSEGDDLAGGHLRRGRVDEQRQALRSPGRGAPSGSLLGDRSRLAGCQQGGADGCGDQRETLRKCHGTGLLVGSCTVAQRHESQGQPRQNHEPRVGRKGPHKRAVVVGGRPSPGWRLADGSRRTTGRTLEGATAALPCQRSACSAIEGKLEP